MRQLLRRRRIRTGLSRICSSGRLLYFPKKALLSIIGQINSISRFSPREFSNTGNRQRCWTNLLEICHYQPTEGDQLPLERPSVDVGFSAGWTQSTISVELQSHGSSTLSSNKRNRGVTVCNRRLGPFVAASHQWYTVIIRRWTHRPTWPDCRQDLDRSIYRDGVCVGRTYRFDYGPQEGAWAWFGAWGGTDSIGTAPMLQEALEAIRIAAPTNEAVVAQMARLPDSAMYTG